jgi:hypothetical protein
MQIKKKTYKKILLRNVRKVFDILIVVTFKSIFYLKIH